MAPQRERKLPQRLSPILLLLFFLCFASLSAVPSAARVSEDGVSGDALLLLSLDVKESDPGQKWVFDALTGYLLSHSGRGRDKTQLADVKLFKFSDLSFSLLPPGKGGQNQLLLIATLAPSNGQFGITYGDTPLRLNVRDTKNSAQKGLLTYLLGIGCGVPPESRPDSGVYFNPSKEDKERLSAFYVSDTQVMLASNSTIVKSALSGKKGLSSTPAYRQIMSLLPGGWDAYGYASNTEAPFPHTPGCGWQTLLFSLLEGVGALGFSLDVQDEDHSRLVLVIVPEDPSQVGKLRGRLEPQMAFLIAKFLDKLMKSEISYEDLPGALRINARLGNTAPFWHRLFKIAPEDTAPRTLPAEKKSAT